MTTTTVMSTRNNTSGSITSTKYEPLSIIITTSTAASIAFNDTFTLQSLFFQKFYLFCESSNSFLIFKTKASFKFSKIPKFKDK